MKFGASTFIWVSPFSNDSLYLFEHVKKQGFDVLEVCVEDPEVVDGATIAKAAKAFEIEPIICGAFGPGRDISSENQEERETGVAYIKTCIDIAYQAGAKLVSGPMYSEVGKIGLQTPEAKKIRRQWAVESMKDVAVYAKEKGVKLAVEPLNRFETDFLNTVDQGLDFFDEIGADNVGFLLDTFHMNIEEKSIGLAIRRAGNKVFNFHACGNDRGTPGEDHINWDEIKEALEQIGYNDYLIIESFNTDVKEIARAVSLWRPLAESADALATNGLVFLKGKFK